MLVHDYLARNAERTPDKPALICGENRLTYKEFDALAGNIARGLLEHGIERGDRVLVWLPNSIEAVAAIFGILKAGAVFVPIHSDTKTAKIEEIASNSRAAALFAPERQRGNLAGIEDAAASMRFCVICPDLADSPEAGRDGFFLPFSSFTEPRSDAPIPCKNIDIDLACLIYTSGSTGDIKGVMETHRNMIAAASSITEYLENVPDDIILSTLPLSFDYGLYQVIMSVLIGATLIVERSFAFPHAVLTRMVTEKVTGFPGVPTMFAVLLQMDLQRYDLSSLRYITNTAAALPASHIMKLRAAFPHVRLYSMYGLTECKRVAYMPPEELDRCPDSVGKAIPNCEVLIVDSSGTPVAPNTTGELIVRGSNVMQGYWEMPEATAAAFRPGRYPDERFLYTGDLFRMDEDGFLYFVGREDDILKVKGEKVAPREIENILHSMPVVAEAVVAGAPDPLLGNRLKAIVVLRAGAEATEREIMAFCASRLEEFKVPRAVEFRDSLPKTQAGKVDRKALQ